MLTIIVPEQEIYDSGRNLFINVKETTLTLEHSLVSISKWESIFNKPFISKTEKTKDEIIEYIKCMTLTKNVDPNVYLFMPVNVIKAINDYISAPMSATTFSKNVKEKPNREIITSELIYYWMVAYQIPFEAQKWHINRLLTLIKICSIKNAPSKKMSKSEILRQNSELNNARRAYLKTKG